MSSALLAFIEDKCSDTRGRTWHDYLVADNSWWEKCHEHVQWAFPLPEPSKMQPAAPVADMAYFDAVGDDPVLRARMVSMLGRYIAFLDTTTQWRCASDHNHLRITRVIRCLVLCGMEEYAHLLFNFVTELVSVPEQTVWYWKEALNESPAWLQDTP